MESANLDLVRSIYAAWERGDYSSSEWAHPNIECVIADGPAPGRWMGAAAMAAAWRDFMSAWEDWRVEVDEYRELDSEHVLALESRSARAKISGLRIGQMAGQTRSKGASLFHVRDGRVTRFVTYFDRSRALVDLMREGYEGWARDS
jgi:ketosteroid isomerase-like protein